MSATSKGRNEMQRWHNKMRAVHGHSCPGKVQHKTEQEAEIAKHAMEAKTNKPFNTYWCHHCHFWHVGSQYR